MPEYGRRTLWLVLKFAQPAIVQYLAKSDDAIQRRPQLVRHVGKKHAFHAVGGFDAVVSFFQDQVLVRNCSSSSLRSVISLIATNTNFWSRAGAALPTNHL